MQHLDRLETLFVVWAFVLQAALIIHFALRKPFFESYTLNFGWVIYALGIPAVVIGIILLLGEKRWPFWLGGFLFLIYAAYGYWVDYVKAIPWRTPMRPAIAAPYVTLYLSAVMFYWWPLGLLSRRLWLAFAVLFVIGTALNVTSH